LLLRQEYGEPEWVPNKDPIGTLVQTVLSQNTSDSNSGRAYKSLRDAFPAWESLLKSDVEAVAESIKWGGLNRVKAARIKQIIRLIAEKRGAVTLNFLEKMSMQDSEKWLLELPGVGLKTARCVQLFSLGMPALPVDTHVLRVSKRLGIIGGSAAADEAHRLLQERVKPGDVYHFHILMIMHGRKVCHARTPDCPHCVLRGHCDYHSRGLYAGTNRKTAVPD